MILADWLPFTVVGALAVVIGIAKLILTLQDRAERRRVAAEQRAWAAEASHRQRLKYDADYQHGWDVAENIINEGEERMRDEETITLTVTGRPELIAKFKGLMCLLHHAGAVGHSGTFGMSLDGDGPDRLHVEGIDLENYMKGADRIGGVGYHVELSTCHGFAGLFTDLQRTCHWVYDRQGNPL